MITQDFYNKIVNSNRIIGVVFIVTGLYFIIATACDNNSVGTFPAIGFLLIMLGSVFFYPMLIKGKKDDGASAIRFLGFMIISCFVFVTIKFGWGKDNFDQLKLNNTWAYIIGAALGSKAIQSLGENNIFGKSGNNTPSGSLPNTNFPKINGTNPNIPLHDNSKITPPPVDPPPHIK